jgi:hypothetical protein
MEIAYQDIYFPPICEKALVAKLHFIENPMLQKKVRKVGEIKLEYEQILEIQKQIILGSASSGMNSVLLDALSGNQPVSQALEELSRIDSFPRRFLPRRRNPEWNKRAKELQELIGIEYSEKPRFKKQSESYEPEDVLKPNYAVVNNLSARGVLNPANPVSCSVYMSLWNLGIGAIADNFLNSFPNASLIGLIAGTGFGFSLGMIAQEFARAKLPFKEAGYLDWKIKELEIKSDSKNQVSIKIYNELPELTPQNLKKLSRFQRTRESYN